MSVDYSIENVGIKIETTAKLRVKVIHSKPQSSNAIQNNSNIMFKKSLYMQK